MARKARVGFAAAVYHLLDRGASGRARAFEVERTGHVDVQFLHSWAAIVLCCCAWTAAGGENPYARAATLFPELSDPQDYAAFGASVAVDGDYIVVGAPGTEVGGVVGAGAVFVYSSTTRTLLATLKNPHPTAPNPDNENSYSDGFGVSVAISGTRVAVGAPGDHTGTAVEGTVYVYDVTSATPERPIIALDNPSSSPARRDFGTSVAISGTRVVVGARADGTAGAITGSAYVYDLASATPRRPVVTLNNPTPATYDDFGASVAISGTHVVVGAPRDESAAEGAGTVYMYDVASAAPATPVATIHNPSPPEPRADYSVPNDEFGRSVAISGARVVVGTPGDIGKGNPEGPFNDENENTGAAYVYDVASATPTTPVASFDYPAQPGSRFGEAVAISGTRVAVSAPRLAQDAGAAYAYDMAGATPETPIATLNNPRPANDANDDRFGGSLAISGTRLVVGAHLDDTLAYQAGSVHIYDLTSATSATPVATLNNPLPKGSHDAFGAAMAISGTLLLVGAPDDDTGAENAGRAYVYELASAMPTKPVATLNNPTPAANDGFGKAVAISGSRVVVVGAGSVFVYDLASATPAQPTVTLTNPAPGGGNYFASSVGISGTRVVVGARQVYVYDLASPTPKVPVTTLNNPGSASDGDGFGLAVAISGTRVVVGAQKDDTGAKDAGSAYVYDLGGATPGMPVATLNNPTPHGDFPEYFGNAVAISGARVVVGASWDHTASLSAGAAYVYDVTSGTPGTPIATLNNPTPSKSGRENFGNSVAISGKRVAVGAYGDGTGARSAGSAYVYDVAGATPETPLATLKNPTPAEFDYFGTSVAISEMIVSVGAVWDSTVGFQTGAVYLYDGRPRTGVVNISTRLAVQTGENVLIGGFIVQGNAAKKVLIRALGPSLTVDGKPVAGALQDPVLRLLKGQDVVGTNDNWRSAQEQEIIDTKVPPANNRESAILATLHPGVYTAVVTGKQSGTGIGLVEVYDLGDANLGTANTARLANISTRGFVQQNDNVMIGGFIVSGASTKLLLRALGPSLVEQGVADALPDTVLDLIDGNGSVIVRNDDWRTGGQEQQINDTTIPPPDNRESAVVATLNPGAYTAVIRGKDNRLGVALVEMYVLQ